MGVVHRTPFSLVPNHMATRVGGREHLSERALIHCGDGSHLGESWRLPRVCFHTNNMAVVAMLQKQNGSGHREVLVFLLGPIPGRI